MLNGGFLDFYTRLDEGFLILLYRCMKVFILVLLYYLKFLYFVRNPIHNGAEDQLKPVKSDSKDFTNSLPLRNRAINAFSVATGVRTLTYKVFWGCSLVLTNIGLNCIL